MIAYLTLINEDSLEKTELATKDVVINERTGIVSLQFDTIIKPGDIDASTDLDKINKAVAGYYSISCAILKTHERSRRYSQARAVSMRLMRETTRATLLEIARFYDRDHSVVARSKAVLDKSSELQQDYDTLLKKVKRDKA